MLRRISQLMLVASIGFSGLAAAADTVPADVVKRLQQARPDLKFGAIQPSVVPGLFKVQIEQGPVIYVTASGGHFFTGDLFEVRAGEFINLAELGRQDERRDLMAEVKESDMIVFAPMGEVKGTVTVFTDVDCFYCQKLHKEVPELNRMGIKVRYLAYPRAGVGSESYRKIATAWCAKNPQQAITRLKAQQTLPENVCADNPVAAQYLLGQRVGVSGTPALLLEDGALLPGYMPARDLAQRLGAI